MFQSKRVQGCLSRILYLWSIRHPASGYVQGINDLATPFFLVFLAEQIAWCRDHKSHEAKEKPVPLESKGSFGTKFDVRASVEKKSSNEPPASPKVGVSSTLSETDDKLKWQWKQTQELQMKTTQSEIYFEKGESVQVTPASSTEAPNPPSQATPDPKQTPAPEPKKLVSFEELNVPTSSLVGIIEFVKDIKVDELDAEILRQVESETYWCLTKLLDGIKDNYTFAQPVIQLMVHKLSELVHRIDGI